MRILLINPNTSAHVTERMVEQARKTAGSKAEIVGATATFGPQFINSRAANTIAAHACLDVAARQASGFDAIVLGVSMDTGLAAVRELLDMPVVGMAEAGLKASCTLGARVGCLTLGNQLLPLYREMTAGYGMSDRVQWKAIELPAAYGTDIAADVAIAIRDACEQMVKEESIDVVALCGAVLAGYAETISEGVSVPVVDCIDAAVRTAISLVERPVTDPPRAFARNGVNSIGLSRELENLLVTSRP